MAYLKRAGFTVLDYFQAVDSKPNGQNTVRWIVDADGRFKFVHFNTSEIKATNAEYHAIRGCQAAVCPTDPCAWSELISAAIISVGQKVTKAKVARVERAVKRALR